MPFQNPTVIIGSLIIGIIIILLGGLVYSTNRKDLRNQIFFLLSISVFIWILSVTARFSGASENLILSSTKLSYAIMAIIAFIFLYFSYIFPTENKYKFPALIAILTSFIIALISLFTPYIIKDVILVDDIQKNIFGSYIYIFGIYFGSYIGWGLYNLISKRRYLDLIGIAQVNFMIAGTIFAAVIGFSSNFIIPTIAQTTTTEKYGPFAILLLILFTTYAILKHHLFNIKVIATDLLTFSIWGFILTRILVSDSLRDIIINSAFFAFVLGFGLLLIRSVRKEVKQREKLEVLTRELEDKNLKLVELDKIRSEFLSFASHQVKAPMTVVKGFASLIYEGSYGAVSEKVKETARKIEEVANQLIGLINNLLDLRRVEEGKMDYKFEETDIVALVSGLIENFKLIANQKGLALSFESDKPLIKIKADAEKLRQVIQNLIDNAIKYTKQGYAKATIKDESEAVLITIEDTGRGMSPEFQKRLFDRFNRDETVKKEIAGTGLGLYIAKEIIKAHGGEIWAESDGLDTGSRFLVRLRKIFD